jgi:hypothetical protein
MDYEIFVESDLLERMTPDQAKLAQLMSDISEEHYCAAWNMGNEFRLWRALTDPNDDRAYGMEIISQEAIDHLRMLSERVGGWIVCRDAGETFIPMAEWLAEYSENCS